MSLTAAALPYIVGAALLCGTGAGGGLVWMLKDGQVQRAKAMAAAQKTAVGERDRAIARLETSERDLRGTVRLQSDQLAGLVTEGHQRSEAAATALAAVRRSQRATESAIAQLDVRIQAPAASTLDCQAAVDEIRAEIRGAVQ